MTLLHIRKHLDTLAKPTGSLGRLEDLAARLCEMQQTLTPVTAPRRAVLFAADHGVVAEGVSAWPSSVTGHMIRTIVAGRSASARLATTTNTDLRVVDVGSLTEPLAPQPNYRCAKVCSGTRNLALEPALTKDEFHAAFAVGQQEADDAMNAGCQILIAGEMGIGNTTAASCLTALLTGADAHDVVGRGAGADDAVLEKKRHVVRNALARYRHLNSDGAIEAMSGLEIAAMAGFIHETCTRGRTLLLDGFVVTAAALVVAHLWPDAVTRMIAAHRSAEPGHSLALKHLGLEPILDGWRMRLGEATGALTALPLLDAAAAMLGMSTLAEVVGR
ncbi:MAG: nicotinate-nucleotide--dimethylbenzimidazole phosphoribosyltransferase [Planctomycetes bacterium]|nr:nicotinate-nucleotide--dimethylbenzimidazole phosphoribosyltransferase [Planctomycetota bacterium]